jgi:hypothetical protein
MVIKTVSDEYVFKVRNAAEDQSHECTRMATATAVRQARPNTQVTQATSCETKCDATERVP